MTIASLTYWVPIVCLSLR